MSMFEQKIRDFGLVFGLTQHERDRLPTAEFWQKPRILEEINKLNHTRVLRIKRIVHFDGEFLKEEATYIMPDEIDTLAEDMMDLSISYAILWIETDIIGFNEIAVARTAHHTTNIDADVIGALLDRLGQKKKENAGNGME